MGASKWFFSASGVIMLIGAFAIAGNGLNFGIDFEGGTRITAPLEQAARVDERRATVVREAGLDDAEVQTIDNPELGDNVVQISSRLGPARSIAAAQDALEDRVRLRRRADDGVDRPDASARASPARRCIAIIASLSVISVYITLRFEWKVAVPVLIALLHDLLITGGVYALTGREVTTSTVAALLTILGFSLYDTIIVFDRVRENIPRMPSAAFSQIVNRSMSEVVVRSLATSFCTLLPVLALYFFGGETLQDFAFALIVGTASGTYSSIFIAAPVLTHWKEREPVYRRARAPDPRDAGLRSRVRDRRRRAARSTSRRPSRAAAGASVTAAAGPVAGRLAGRVRRHGRQPRRRGGGAPRRARRGRAAPRPARPAAAAPAGAATAPHHAARRRRRGRVRQPPPRSRSRASRATASTGGRADGPARVGHGRASRSGTSPCSCPTASGRASSARSSARWSARSSSG